MGLYSVIINPNEYVPDPTPPGPEPPGPDPGPDPTPTPTPDPDDPTDPEEGGGTEEGWERFQGDLVPLSLQRGPSDSGRSEHGVLETQQRGGPTCTAGCG